jgi:predicted nucleic acid-binding protein
MGAVVLDASVILGLLDPLDALHLAAARATRERRAAGVRLLMPASVLAEVLVAPTRHGKAELALTRRLLADAFGDPHPVDESVAVAAAAWRARRPSLRLPDALVLATADAVRADGVLTGDKRWRGLDRRIEIVGD